MDRYNYTKILKTQLGKRYLKTVRYPVIERSTKDLYIVARDGDRLDNLANQYYKDVTLWWIIARANNIGKGDLTVPLGKQIRIPSNYTDIVDSFNSLNK
tara:strand:- start:326 stop:622 length:297 start_codon:yes stop_codon:yes gene_type:complete